MASTAAAAAAAAASAPSASAQSATTTPHKLCMIPGPIEFHEEVLAQMATPATSHIDPGFIQELGASLEMLRQVFQSKKGQPFIVSGSGTLGWDMVASNLVEAGEKALVLNTGLFGDRFGECLETYGAQVSHVHAPTIGATPLIEDIEKAITEKGPFKVVTVTHVDTSTGVLTDVPAIASLVKRLAPSTLVVVDGVCSVGGEDLQMDAWGVDVTLTASQKALGTPPGLSVVVASEAAMQVFRTRRSPVSSYYASWAKWTPIMNAYEARKPSYFATPAVQLVKALHTSLRQILAVTLDERYRQHAEVSDMIKDTVESWGLRLVPTSRKHAAHTLTAVYYPEGVQAAGLLSSITGKGVVVAGGLHPKIAAQYFRIGHMGLSVTHEQQLHHIRTTLQVVEHALRENGFSPRNK